MLALYWTLQAVLPARMPVPRYLLTQQLYDSEDLPVLFISSDFQIFKPLNLCLS